MGSAKTPLICSPIPRSAQFVVNPGESRRLQPFKKQLCGTQLPPLTTRRVGHDVVIEPVVDDAAAAGHTDIRMICTVREEAFKAKCAFEVV